MQQVEGLVDLVQLEVVRNVLVELQGAAHVPVHQLRHVRPGLEAAKSSALPHTTSDQLERPGLDFLARSSNTWVRTQGKEDT